MDSPLTNAPTVKARNPHRITLREWLDRQGFEHIGEASRVLQDSVMPALCDEDCAVEPDGRCPHGCPSPLLAMGF